MMAGLKKIQKKQSSVKKLGVNPQWAMKRQSSELLTKKQEPLMS